MDVFVKPQELDIVMQGQKSQELISVIIPTKNEGDMLEACLSSVYTQSLSPFEVIIVDGGSTDNTLNIAEKFGAKVIKEQGFSSPANARNLGVKSSRGTILLITDADVILDKDCLKEAVEIFGDKEIIAVLPSEENIDDSYIELLQRKWNQGSRSSAGIGVKRAVTSGFVVFFRREVLESVNFDTRYGFGEDDDLNTRIQKEFKGCRTVIAPNCRVISHSPHTLKEFGARYKWWGRTFFAYFSKHIGFKSILNLGSLVLPVFVLVLCFASLLSSNLFVFVAVLLALFVARILIVCFRSRSVLFIQFVCFDLARSFFFLVGLLQSLFIKGKGR